MRTDQQTRSNHPLKKKGCMCYPQLLAFISFIKCVKHIQPSGPIHPPSFDKWVRTVFNAHSHKLLFLHFIILVQSKTIEGREKQIKGAVQNIAMLLYTDVRLYNLTNGVFLPFLSTFTSGLLFVVVVVVVILVHHDEEVSSPIFHP